MAVKTRVLVLPGGRRIRLAQGWEAPERPRRVSVLALSGRQLLRLLLHEPEVWERLARCSRCGAEEIFVGWPEEEARPCGECGATCTRVDTEWWKRAVQRMRVACRRDQKLLPALKAEWRARYEDAPLPRFPEPFSWLNDAWERTAPRGRPFDALTHYQLANIVDLLQCAGVRWGEIVAVLTEPDTQKRRQLYEALPERSRRFLGEFGKGIDDTRLRASGAEELWRSVRWARAGGERVRPRQSKARE